MKVPIDLTEMYDRQLLTLARKCIRELNDRQLAQFKVVKK